MDRMFSIDADRLDETEPYEPVFDVPTSSSAIIDRVFAPVNSTSDLGHLSPREQSVIALAAFDHRVSVEPTGMLSRLIHHIFGGASANRLADEGLEALRRYAVLYRSDGLSLAPIEKDRFRSAGYSEPAIVAVESLVTRAQFDRRSRH